MAFSRSEIYSLLGRMFVSGLTAESYEALLGRPDFAGLLPEPFDSDQAAADHQHLLGFNVFPYESVFLEPSGQLGGPVSESVRRAYERAGFPFEETSGIPDHLGQELSFLAYLSRAGTRADEQAIPQLQQAFLEEHLLRWLPPLVVAIGRQGQPLYGALASLTLETVMNHAGELGTGAGGDFSLPGPPWTLDQSETGLRQIVEALLKPAYSGVYIGRDDIGRLAALLSLPAGFGERTQMLQGLFRSAANYGRLEGALEALQAMAAVSAGEYREMAVSWEPFLQALVWAEQATRTAELLAQMGSRIAGPGSSSW